jgi:hypothetical protein
LFPSELSPPLSEISLHLFLLPLHLFIVLLLPLHLFRFLLILEVGRGREEGLEGEGV